MEEINKAFEFIEKKLNINELERELRELEKKTFDTSFWENEENEKIIERISYLKNLFEDWEKLTRIYADLTRTEADKNLQQLSAGNLKSEIINFFYKYILTEKYDKNFAILNIYSGTGGKDAEDWVGILRRMYEKFLNRLRWNYYLIDEGPNEHGGFKFVSLKINENYAYGILKSEKGVHRLVRISPFSPQRLRHTSFAYVEVLPLIEKPEFKIREEDIEIDFFRASGPGGQNVNKVETGVRVTYKPLNITVSCQTERYQHRNRELALQILYSKIQNLLDEKQKKELEELKGQKIEISWGYQTRNYIFDPYKLIKDLKTKKETNKIDDILEGKIEILHPYEEILNLMLK